MCIFKTQGHSTTQYQYQEFNTITANITHKKIKIIVSTLLKNDKELMLTISTLNHGIYSTDDNKALKLFFQ